MTQNFKTDLMSWAFTIIGCASMKAFKARPPIDRIAGRSPKTPFTKDVEAAYDLSKERIKDANYSIDLQLAKLKGCV